jgi:DNA-binding NarL/FixJ family response regulator
MYDSKQLVRQAIDAGARAYVLKSNAGRNVIEAVEALSRHQPFFATKTSGTLPQEHRKHSSEAVLSSRLTDKEIQIVQFLAEGKLNTGIASVLGISVKTVETHRDAAMSKLGISSIVEPVYYGIRNNLVKLR